MRRRALVAAALAAALLAGCSVDARDEIRGTVEDITLDANARDAGAVRRGVDELLRQLDTAVREGELTSAEAAQIAGLATRVRDAAALLEAEPTPTPTTESPSPTPSPTPSRTPSPTPTRAPEPTEEPEPTQQTEPPPTEEPEEPLVTLSPVAVERSGPPERPAASPTG